MRWAVVGAGYAGIAVAGALIAAGVEVDVLDARDGVGGLWRDAIYDSVDLITSRKVSAYPGLPMPAGLTFPTGPELQAYLVATAESTGVTARLQQHRVDSVEPNGRGWLINGVGPDAGEHEGGENVGGEHEGGDYEGRAYDGVVLATGLYTEPRIPVIAGDLGIPSLHTSTYRNVRQLGDRVLVVGLGNSGADVAADCVDAGRSVTMAVRRARHVVPRSFAGRPITELHPPPLLPAVAVRVGLDPLMRGWAFRRRHRAGLPEPSHLLFSESPVVHDRLLDLIGDGSVTVRPAVVRFDGDLATFADGTAERFDTIVWATGYDWSLPVARALVDGCAQGQPALVGGVWSTVSRGLAVVGLREPQHGRGPYFAAVAELVVAGALAQADLDEPIGLRLASVHPADRQLLIDDDIELPRLRSLTIAARDLT